MITAGEVAERIRTGRATSRELTEELLARIADGTEVNAVVEVRREHALAAADRADAAVHESRRLGPLHGVPMTVKECFDVAGMHTTWGNPAFAEYVADRDAVVVERLQRAGAIIVGKSNVHTMLADFGQTTNEVYGRTNNPADLTRTVGGSSGGAAAALAADHTYLEYGSDLVGSIRLPAAYCGVYGLRPTNGLVPQRGFQVPGTPYLPSELPNLSTIGPLARSAADLRIALRVTGGAETSPYSHTPHTPDTPRPPRHARLQDYRVGVVLDHPAAPVTSDVGDALSDLVDRIATSGAKIVDNWPNSVDPTQQAEEFGRQLEVFFVLHGGEPTKLTVDQLLATERNRLEARARWQQYFDDVDVFVCPTSFTVAFPHGTTTIDGRPYEAQAFWIAHASLTGHPALSIPIGHTSRGLPTAAQVIGPRYEDDSAITFAELLAD